MPRYETFNLIFSTSASFGDCICSTIYDTKAIMAYTQNIVDVAHQLLNTVNIYDLETQTTLIQPTTSHLPISRRSHKN